MASLSDLLEAGAVEAQPGELPAKQPSTQLATARAARRHVHRGSHAFLERLDGRLARDRKRLQEYYRALRLGDSKRAARGRTGI